VFRFGFAYWSSVKEFRRKDYFAAARTKQWNNYVRDAFR
jgi:hypothetical protein